MSPRLVTASGAPEPESAPYTTHTSALRPDIPLCHSVINARELGTIWGPHAPRAAGQPACDRTSRYTRAARLNCEDACSNVLGVKEAGSRLKEDDQHGTEAQVRGRSSCN